MVPIDQGWAKNFLQAVKAIVESASPPPAPPVTQTVDPAQREDSRWTAAKVAMAQTTPWTEDSLGWPDDEARQRITTDSPGSYCDKFRAFSTGRRDVLNKLSKKEKLALAAPPISTKGLLPYHVELLREGYTKSFSEARAVYIQSYVYHVTSHAVSLSSVKESIQHDSHRLEGFYGPSNKSKSDREANNRERKRSRDRRERS